jgi:hypothetical protein
MYDSTDKDSMPSAAWIGSRSGLLALLCGIGSLAAIFSGHFGGFFLRGGPVRPRWVCLRPRWRCCLARRAAFWRDRPCSCHCGHCAADLVSDCPHRGVLALRVVQASRRSARRSAPRLSSSLEKTRRQNDSQPSVPYRPGRLVLINERPPFPVCPKSRAGPSARTDPRSTILPLDSCGT